MSIIIRLQNLPWAANSVDIRRYFAGLSIPEGGVHIVGGEKGDAFIAFGTDEDARQAMERDGGKIKDMKVKLLLSSRTEMARVIEQARNQNLSLQTPAAVKAAVNDSDRRKVRERSPSPRRREKSPGRERERRRSTKRDRSRTRSRSPRRSKDRERDNDRHGDRSRRDERHLDDLQDRYRNTRDFSPRESSQDRRQYPTDKDVLPPRQNLEANKVFDPRMGSTPQTYDTRQMEGAVTNFNLRHENMLPHGAPYLDSQKPVSEASPYLFPAAMSTMSIKSEAKGANEQLQPPPTFTAVSAFQFDKRLATNTVGNYESKRPSPTPATSAPNVDSGGPYTKNYGTTDPYSSHMAHGYGDYPATSYGTVQTAERGAIPAIPNERRVLHSNQPVYGAEPHARYDQIPEANQAGRSANASAPREMAGHESGLYGKMLPSNMPTVTSSSTTAVNKPPRRSRFEPMHSVSEDNQFHAASAPKADLRAHDSFARQMDAHSTLSKSMESSFPQQRDRPIMGNEAPWPPHTSGSSHSSWIDDGQGQFGKQHSGVLIEHHEVVPMELDEESLVQTAPPMRNAGLSHSDNRNLRSGHLPETRMNARGPYSYHNKRSVDGNIESKSPSNNREPLMSEARRGNTMLNRNGPPNRAPPAKFNIPSLTVEIRGLPFDVSDCDVVDLFRGIFVPHENIKLQRNQMGNPNGCAYVKFLNKRDFEEGLARNRAKLRNSQIQISPCPLSVFENARCDMNISQEKSLKQNSSLQSVSEVGHSQRKNIESNIPARKIDPTSSRNTSEPVSATKAVETTARKPLEQLPVRKPSDAVSQRKQPSEQIPPQKSTEQVPTRKQEHTSPRKPLEPMSQRKLVENPPQREPVEPIRPRKPLVPTPPRKALEPVPQRKPLEPSAARKPQESKPPRQLLEHLPQRRPPEHSRKGFEPNPHAHRSNLEPCEEDLVVELKGLPYTCEDEEIVNFFDGLGILDIFIELGPDGRATGVGFVEFATPADFQAALDMNGKRIGHRYVDVVVASKEIMAVARGERPKPPLLPQGPPRELSQPLPRVVRSHPPSDPFCVVLSELPKHVKNRDIADFFADVNVIPRAIHIMLGSGNAHTGEAFAEFNTHREFNAALQKDGCILAGFRILVSPISYQEMLDILGTAGPTPALPPSSLLTSPHESERPKPRRALMPLPVTDDIPMEDRRPPRDGPQGRGRSDFPPDDMLHFDHPEPLIGGRPSYGRMRGVPPRPDGSRPPRPSFRHSGPPQSSLPPRGTSFHPQQTGPPRFPGPPRNGHGPKDFGLPGCVVAINNLHFRAGLEDLLDFFHNFDIDKNSIIRKYNESGQATGEARVAFNCHEDALLAVKKLDMKPIMGRPISLSII